MRLIDRTRVTTARPRIHIGRRQYRAKDGSMKPCAVWWAVWSREGRQFEHSLHVNSKHEALRAARGLGKRLRKGLEPTTPPPDPDLSELKDRYIEYQVNREHAPKTIEKYTLVLGKLVEWCKSEGIVKAATFDEKGYWRFHRWMLDEGYTAKTRYDRLIVVKQLFKWAARNQLLVTNPIVAAELIRKPAPTMQPCFTPEQVGALLDAADDTYRPVFATMAYTGLRFGEIRDLQWDDIRFSDGACGSLVVRHGGSTETTKSGSVRRIPLHPALRKLLLAIPRRANHVFCYQRKPHAESEWFPLVERVTLMTLKQLCGLCGFALPATYKLHSMRHCFCSMCARSNVPFKYALVWLGHSSSEMLDYYFHAFDETAETAMKAISYPVATGDQGGLLNDYSI